MSRFGKMIFCGEGFCVPFPLQQWRNINEKEGAAAVTLIFLVLSALAFAQTSNATLGGTISDASGALILA